MQTETMRRRRRGDRHLPDQRHRLRRVLRRQRQAGRPLLPLGLRLPARRLPRAPRPAPATAPATCSQQNKVRLVLTTALGPDHADRRARAPARRRRPRHRALGGRRARGVRARGRAGRDAGGRAGGAAGRRRRGRHRRHPHLRRHHPQPGRAAELPGRCSCPGFRPVETPLQPGAGRAPVRRPLRRQRRAGPDEHLGQVLRGRDGLPQPDLVRRQGHLDRVLAR